jgi:hypothetical protein
MFRFRHPLYSGSLKFPKGRCLNSLVSVSPFSSFVDLEIDEVDLEIEEANSRCKGDVQLKNAGSRGYGVFAARDFKAGETVMQATALQTVSEPESHSIQVGWRKHVMMDLPSQLANHMCDPNMRLQPNDSGAYDFIAMRPIQADDEIGWDYETTEHEMDAQFACECGAKRCRKHLKGFRHHGKKVLEAHGEECVAPYLLSADGKKIH